MMRCICRSAFRSRAGYCVEQTAMSVSRFLDIPQVRFLLDSQRNANSVAV